MILFHSSQREMRALLSWSEAEQQFYCEEKFPSSPVLTAPEMFVVSPP